MHHYQLLTRKRIVYLTAYSIKNRKNSLQFVGGRVKCTVGFFNVGELGIESGCFVGVVDRFVERIHSQQCRIVQAAVLFIGKLLMFINK